MAQQEADNQQMGVQVQGLQAVTAGVRETRQPGELVGGTGEGIANLRGQTDAAGQATRQALSPFGTQGRFGMNGFNQFSSMYGTAMMSSIFNRRQQLRMPLTLGFTPVVRPNAADVGTRVQTRLAKIPQLRGNGPLTVEMNSRVAILRGEVLSEDARDLVARVVLLEPGISDVRNELRVATAKTAP
jgi:osmotically-inducible protein OsmY